MDAQMEIKGIHAFVEGRVQGVWYRDFTKRLAQEMGVTGWVKNIDDGRVELKAFGHDELLSRFTEKLHEGPPAADVTTIVITEISVERFESFDVLR